MRLDRSKSRQERDRAGEAGLTLVELLVAVVILGMIMSAMGAAFFLAYRSTTAANDRIAESIDAQLLATYWSADVASIDADGYLAGAQCGSDQELVTVGWDLLDDPTNPTATRVSYAGRNAGEDSEIVRHRCSGASVTPVESIVVARHFGEAGSSDPAASWVSGSSGPAPDCNDRTCTFRIDGTFPFEVVAARRVPGEPTA